MNTIIAYMCTQSIVYMTTAITYLCIRDVVYMATVYKRGNVRKNQQENYKNRFSYYRNVTIVFIHLDTTHQKLTKNVISLT